MLYESKYYGIVNTDVFIRHHGVKGQKWGIRRFQNEDGSLTEAGRKRYGVGTKLAKQVGADFATPFKTLGRQLERTKQAKGFVNKFSEFGGYGASQSRHEVAAEQAKKKG